MSTTSLLKNTSTGEVIDLTANTRLVVGRNPKADLVLTDLRCSRNQFQVLRKGVGFVLEPLSETCPTLCDGRTIKGKIALSHGCIIEIPGYSFEFLTSVTNKPEVEIGT